ncbi:MAG: hypothetical protein R2698_14745 [Microthrixaceae bacterium]
MISEQGFADVRVAAALNHMFPGLETRLSGGDRLLVEVAWSPSESGGEAVLRVHPCAFRRHVAACWARHLDGKRMRFLDLDGDPVVEVGMTADAVHHPAGMLRLPLAGQWVYAFGTAMDPDRCAVVGADIIAAFERPEEVLGVGIRGDGATQVSIVYAETAENASSSVHHAVVDVLQQLKARFAVSRLLDELPDAAGRGDRLR